MSDIEKTLQDRGAEYGRFLEQSTTACKLKDAMQTRVWYEKLLPDQREALEMIAVKIARILNGNPNNHDSWHDIAGYAKLVADRLAKK